jgi:hypothetical protein
MTQTWIKETVAIADEYLARPMSLRRIETYLVLEDCVAVCNRDEGLREWYKNAIRFLERFDDNGQIVVELHESEIEAAVC